MKRPSYLGALSYLDVTHLSHSSYQSDRETVFCKLLQPLSMQVKTQFHLLLLAALHPHPTGSLLASELTVLCKINFLEPNAVIYVKAIFFSYFFLICKKLYKKTVIILLVILIGQWLLILSNISLPF